MSILTWYPMIETIALHNEIRENLLQDWRKIAEEDSSYDWSEESLGVRWEQARIIRECYEKNGYLYDAEGNRLSNGPPEKKGASYFSLQHTDYSGDGYYGKIFFRAKKDGEYIEIPFDAV